MAGFHEPFESAVSLNHVIHYVEFSFMWVYLLVLKNRIQTAFGVYVLLLNSHTVVREGGRGVDQMAPPTLFYF